MTLLSEAFNWIFERAMPEPNTGCYLWTEGTTPGGYGRHRVAYEKVYGPVPKGLDLDHICRVKCCVNPDHLRIVTRSQNMRYAVFQRSLATHCKRGHEFTPENTHIAIVRDPVHGDRTRRGCKTCSREAARAKGRRKRHVHSVPGAQKDWTHCLNGHEFTPENTGLTKRPDGKQWRWCRECQRERGRIRDRIRRPPKNGPQTPPLLTAWGETKPRAAWAKQYDIASDVVGVRLKLGWTPEKALTHPVRKRKDNRSHSNTVSFRKAV